MDLKAKARAVETVWRLSDTLDYDPVPSGHLEIATNSLHSLGVPNLPSLKNVKVGTNLFGTVEIYGHTVPKDGFDLICYTDGSKKEGKAGNGWSITNHGYAVKSGHQYLGENASVYQSEVVAMTNCLDDLSKYLEGMDRTSVVIYTDCQSLTTSLRQSKSIDSLVQDCRKKLLNLGQNQK